MNELRMASALTTLASHHALWTIFAGWPVITLGDYPSPMRLSDRAVLALARAEKRQGFRALQHGDLEAKLLTAQHEVLRTGPGLEQEIAGRRTGLQITLQP